jgi:thiol-disulfide isomerase/thioredoxin
MSLAQLLCRPLAAVFSMVIGTIVVCQAVVAEQPTQAVKPSEDGLVIPPLPEGTPEELLAFAKGLLPPKQAPKSRAEYENYLKGACRARVEVAERVLAQTKEEDAIFAEGVRLKFESLTNLDKLGEKGAGDTRAAFLTTLANSAHLPLAMLAKRLMVFVEINRLDSGDFSRATAVIKQLADMLAANPNDPQTAGLVSQLGVVLQRVPPGSDDSALSALKTFSEIFEKSDDEKFRKLADLFGRKIRFLTLPGKPMEITGAYLDGKAFDQKAYAGKVILVYFWATWCNFCVNEIPNIQAAHDAYHANGLEVIGISLDSERAAVENFVALRKIQWPILFSGKGGEDPVVQFYGIPGIPQLVLIGRDGNVITMNVREVETLGTRLAELFRGDK